MLCRFPNDVFCLVGATSCSVSCSDSVSFVSSVRHPMLFLGAGKQRGT